MADVDLQYFAVLNEILGQDVFWTVTYYTDDEREGFLFQLQKCGIGPDMIRMCKMEEINIYANISFDKKTFAEYVVRK